MLFYKVFKIIPLMLLFLAAALVKHNTSQKNYVKCYLEDTDEIVILSREECISLSYYAKDFEKEYEINKEKKINFENQKNSNQKNSNQKNSNQTDKASEKSNCKKGDKSCAAKELDSKYYESLENYIGYNSFTLCSSASNNTYNAYLRLTVKKIAEGEYDAALGVSTFFLIKDFKSLISSMKKDEDPNPEDRPAAVSKLLKGKFFYDFYTDTLKINCTREKLCNTYKKKSKYMNNFLIAVYPKYIGNDLFKPGYEEKSNIYFKRVDISGGGQLGISELVDFIVNHPESLTSTVLQIARNSIEKVISDILFPIFKAEKQLFGIDFKDEGKFYLGPIKNNEFNPEGFPIVTFSMDQLIELYNKGDITGRGFCPF